MAGWSLDNGLLALAQLETAGGKKTVKGPDGTDSNNLYNVKDFSGGGIRARDKAEGSNDAYRAYGSPDESTADVKALLARKYPAALTATSPQEFFTALKQGGYATDPLYVSKGVSVANRLGGSMPQVTSPSLQSTSPSLQPFVDAGWGNEIAFAKSKGFDDATIASRLQDEQVKLRAQASAKSDVQSQVANLGAQGKDAFAQVTALRNAGYNDEIEFARKNGFTDEQIVAKIAPIAFQQGKTARDQVNADGSLVTGLKAAGDTVSGLGRGVRQVYNQATGDDATYKQLQDAEAASRGDLSRVARDSTVAGKVGSAAPYLAAALIPGVGEVGGATALGAGIGLAQPTVQGESRLANTAMGAVGGAAPAAALKGLGLAGRVATRTGDDAANIVALKAEGIDVPRSMSSSNSSLLSRALEKVPGARIGVQDAEGTLQAQAQNAIAKRMGIDGGELSSDAINAAEAANRGRYATALGDTSITIPAELRASISNGLKDQIAAAHPMIRAEMTRALTPEITSLEQSGTISAQALNKLRSQLGADGSASTLSAAEKQAYGATRKAVTDTLEQGLPPEQLKALQDANRYHQNIMVGKDVVAKMKDDPSRDVIKALEQAVSSAKNKGDFVRGDATMQDLQGALSSLHRGKASPIGGPAADLLPWLGAFHSGGASLLAGIPANIALRILNSTAPEVRSAVSKMTPVALAALSKKAASAQLGAAMAG